MVSVARMAGDGVAFCVLVERHERAALALARRLLGSLDDARDVAQEAFARAFAAFDRFRADEPFAPWLLRIVYRLCLHRLRDRRRETPLHDADDWPAPAAGVPEVLATARAEVAALERELRGLPAPYRCAFVLRHVHDMPIAQIADVMLIGLVGYAVLGLAITVLLRITVLFALVALALIAMRIVAPAVAAAALHLGERVTGAADQGMRSMLVGLGLL